MNNRAHGPACRLVDHRAVRQFIARTPLGPNNLVASDAVGLSTSVMQDEREIVSLVCRALRPGSVVQVGCGSGAFLAAFKASGVNRVLGLDEAQACPGLAPHEYARSPLQGPFPDSGPVDLVVSLEVGEHISAGASDAFVGHLTQLGPVILFSAAIPGQGGKNHINEQWPAYWAEKFARFDYVLYDVIRPLVWHNRNISVWYRQNMFLVTRSDHVQAADAFRKLPGAPLVDVVHPDLFTEKAERLDGLLNGRFGLGIYPRLFAKILLRKLGLRR